METTMNIEWDDVLAKLDNRGFVRIPSVLQQMQCRDISERYQEHELFRSTINMQRYRFGSGEYKYFSYPLPDPVQRLREQFFEPLVPLANEWMTRLGVEIHYPASLQEFLSSCHSKN